MEMKYVRRSWFRRLMSRLVLRRRGSDMTSLAMLSSGGGIPVRQTKLAPDGVEFSEDVSAARWVEERLADSNMILSQKVYAGRIRTNVPTPGYNI